MSSVDTIPNGSVTSPIGFSAGVASAGWKREGQPDVAVLVSETACSAAGVFTTNRVRAAPVLYDEALLRERPGRLRGVVMNAKYANACTGADGMRIATAMAAEVEKALKLPSRSILTLSTGVIGVPIPLDQAEPAIQDASRHLRPDGGIDAARAIMTTDRVPKHFAVRAEGANGTFTVGGIAKGAGMIHPTMATLLGVITTDAKVEPARITTLLGDVVNRTFNAISVDGDTSTNDSVLVLANGASDVDVDRDSESRRLFDDAIERVAHELALMVVRDGEGATKFVELTVAGAATESMARTVGRVIARSALVKTALAGSDANWGRILAAAGSSGAPLDPNRLTLYAQRRAPEGGPDGEWVTLARDGATAACDEALVQRIFSDRDLALRLDLGLGGAEATVWTCDLSDEYVHINADYRS